MVVVVVESRDEDVDIGWAQGRPLSASWRMLRSTM